MDEEFVYRMAQHLEGLFYILAKKTVWERPDVRTFFDKLAEAESIVRWCAAHEDNNARVLEIIGDGEFFDKVYETRINIGARYLFTHEKEQDIDRGLQTLSLAKWMCRDPATAKRKCGETIAELAMQFRTDNKEEQTAPSMTKENPHPHDKGEIKGRIEPTSQPEAKETKILRYHMEDRVQAARLFKGLQDAGFLGKDTSRNDWLYICGVEDAPKASKPIDWQGTQAELTYLIQEVFGRSSNRWKICASAFTVKGERIKDGNLKSTASQLIKGRLNVSKALAKIVRQPIFRELQG